MIEFKELRVTPDGKTLIIDAAVKDLSYYDNVYIKSVTIDTQDTYSESGSSTNPLFHYEVASVSEENKKRIRLELNSSVLGDITGNMFFVYVTADNVSRDTTPLVTVYLKTAESEELVVPKTKEADLSGTYTGIILEEAVQDWELGTMPQEFIPFTVQPTTVVVDGEEYIWGKVESQAATNKVENGHNIADLEYFCMGERADIYRNMGWPNSIETKYLVDPSKLYDIITIHSAFEGNGLSSDKSERDIHFAIERTDGSKTLLTSVKTALNGTRKFTQLT